MRILRVAGLVALVVSLLAATSSMQARAAAPSTPPQASFRPGGQFPTGFDPGSVALGTVNGDTVLDAVVADTESNAVSVLLGDGAGGFGAKTDFPTGSIPISIALGDLNGDTFLDTVVADLGSGTVSVLLGDGAGGFDAKTDFPTGGSSRSVALADLNGDSFVDLAVVNSEVSVAVLLGNGTGAFGAATEYSAGELPVWVAVADLNGDTFPDLAVASALASEVALLFNDGTGRFGPASFTDGGVCCEPFRVTIGDLNGDGFFDLVTADVTGDSVAVRLGDGVGGFGPHATYGVNYTPYVATLGDVNGDGYSDVVTASSDSKGVTVLLNDGTGALGSRLDLPTPGGDDVAVGDLNGDGKPELVVANGFYSASLSVLLNRTGEPATVPDAPAMSGATAGLARATVSWAAPGWDGGASISGYVVTPYIGADSQTPIVYGSTATVQTVTGLTGGTTYTFTVAATNPVGTGAASAHSNPVTPTAPSVPQAPTIIRNATGGIGSATVSWIAPPYDGGSPIVGYVVTPYVGYSPRPSTTFNSTATTQSVTGLTNGTEYRFRVQAVNAVGTSAFSTVSNPVVPALTVPAAPMIVRNATGGDGSATVSWTAPGSDGGSLITGYVVTPYVGFSPRPPIAFDSTATTETVTGLVNGTEYRFRVQAVNAVGTGPYSTVTNPVIPTA